MVGVRGNIIYLPHSSALEIFISPPLLTGSRINNRRQTSFSTTHQRINELSSCGASLNSSRHILHSTRCVRHPLTRIPYDARYDQVYNQDQPDNEGKFSHELLAGGAAFGAMKLFEDQQRREGEQRAIS